MELLVGKQRAIGADGMAARAAGLAGKQGKAAPGGRGERIRLVAVVPAVERRVGRYQRALIAGQRHANG